MNVKRRNMWVQVLLIFITFGLYSVYWYYWTTRELWELTGREDENIFLWTIFLCLPFTFFYSYYKQGEAFEKVTGGEVNRWLTFALWIVFPPAIWFMVQRKLNSVSDKQIAHAV